MKRNIFILAALFLGAYVLITSGSGCAQIAFPSGGTKDTLAPLLIKSSPENNKLNFTGNKITLTFNEYIEIKDISSNLLVSPLTKNNPTIGSNLKTINIKFRDTLKPNTTYSINFGNSITDVHEGNVFKEFTYTFSTGNFIDSLQFSGKVIVAETGKVDSTLAIYLYKNAVDTEVVSRKPDYITKPDGSGNFTFKHLPPASFKIYALKDGDGGKTYNSKTELFAFSDTDINTEALPGPVALFAYSEEKPPPQTGTPNTSSKKVAEKKLKYSTSVTGRLQDILQPLGLFFTSGLKTFDSSKIIVSDTNFKPLPGIHPTIDSTRKKVTIKINWQPETEYYIIIPKEAFEDSTGNFLEKSDTIRFITKKASDYGKLLLRFKNIDLTQHPVVQFLQNDAVKFSYPVTGNEWSNDRFTPGEYDIRILYDLNNNGSWDPGNYKEKRQPEHAISLPKKLAIKADWDNEREIQL